MIYVNNQELKFTKFPAGEIQGNFTKEFYSSILNNVCIKDSVCVIAYLFSSDSIFLLAQLKQFLNQNFPKEQHLLRLCYQPYGRYDKKMTSEFDVCSLKVFASFLNSMNWDEIIVPDPHSDVISALLAKSVVQEQHEMIYNEVGEAEQYDAIIVPGIDAVKKARKYADEVRLPLLICEKKRDLKTGKILNVEILNEKDIPTTFKDSSGRPHFLVINDTDILSILQKQVKQRQESLSIYKDNGREDLANEEQFEIDIISQFLPTPLTDEELNIVVTEVINELQATSIKDMGKVMNEVKTRAAGKADSSVISVLVKKMLA